MSGRVMKNPSPPGSGGSSRARSGLPERRRSLRDGAGVEGAAAAGAGAFLAHAGVTMRRRDGEPVGSEVTRAPLFRRSSADAPLHRAAISFGFELVTPCRRVRELAAVLRDLAIDVGEPTYKLVVLKLASFAP